MATARRPREAGRSRNPPYQLGRKLKPPNKKQMARAHSKVKKRAAALRKATKNRPKAKPLPRKAGAKKPTTTQYKKSVRRKAK